MVECGSGSTEFGQRGMLAECPEYIGLRMRIFGKPILYMDEIRTYSIDKVLRFAIQSEFLNY